MIPISAQIAGINEGNITSLRIDKREPLAAELHDFTLAVAGKKDPLVSGEDALVALRLAEELLTSGARKVTVGLPSLQAV